MKKIYCLDTNVLVEYADAIYAFEEHEVVIPFIVLIELDELKNRSDAVGQNARSAIRILDSLRSEKSLVEGVVINDKGGILRVSHIVPDNNPRRDDTIIEIVEEVAKQNPDRITKLISNDLNMRIRADVMGIETDGFTWEGQPKIRDEIYSGAAQIFTSQAWIDELYQEGELELPEDLDMELWPNQFLIIKSEKDSSSAICKYKDGKAYLLTTNSNTQAWGLKPRNKEQQFALDILMDPDITIVSLIGRAGCGKSLMAIAAGMEQQMEQRRYDKVIISRPIQAMGKDIGYLPGTLEEKMAPWIQPIKDNLMFLLKGSKNAVETLFHTGKVEIEALTYIRGRSIPNAYIIIDECQNLSAPELKAIITRVGEGSKIVLTGDIEQIDNPYFDPMSNGLTYVVEKFREQKLSGHIKLIKGERSDLASLAAEIL